MVVPSKRCHSTVEKKMYIKLVALNARFTHSCLALFYIRNELKKYLPEARVEILQLTINDSAYETILTLGKGGPDYLFFSAAIWNSDKVESLVRDLHLCQPQCRCVIGGPQAAVVGAALDEELRTIVTGEIESVGDQFYGDLLAGSLAESYGGGALPKHGNTFQFPYLEQDFALHLANRHIYYESSRGCPFSCTYCLSAAEKGVYHKDVAEVCRELELILGHKPKVVRFIDRTFNDIPERALAIWRFLLAEGGDTLFHFEIAPDRFIEEMFELLATVGPGRFQFEIGIQSTNAKTLAAIRRPVDPEQAHACVQRLAGFGTIHLHVDLILGLPFETRQSFAASLNHVFGMGSHYIQMGLLKILPDTPICHTADEYGYVSCTAPPYSILATRWLDHTALTELYWLGECVEKFINNRYFVSLWDYLRSRGEDIFAFFRDLVLLCEHKKFFQLAATQEFMARLLIEFAATRPDREMFVELIRFDWLRCGHRYLPQSMAQQDGAQHDTLKKKLYQELPQELAGVYSQRQRNHFFRKSYFLILSPAAMHQLQLETSATSYCVAILPERQQTLYAFHTVSILELEE